MLKRCRRMLRGKTVAVGIRIYDVYEKFYSNEVGGVINVSSETQIGEDLLHEQALRLVEQAASVSMDDFPIPYGKLDMDDMG